MLSSPSAILKEKINKTHSKLKYVPPQKQYNSCQLMYIHCGCGRLLVWFYNKVSFVKRCKNKVLKKSDLRKGTRRMFSVYSKKEYWLIYSILQWLIVAMTIPVKNSHKSVSTRLVFFDKAMWISTLSKKKIWVSFQDPSDTVLFITLLKFPLHLFH